MKKILIFLISFAFIGCIVKPSSSSSSNSSNSSISSSSSSSSSSNPNPEFTADASTVILWHFDEPSGTISADSSTSGNYPATFDVFNPPITPPDPLIYPILSSSGHNGFGNCLVFDGSKEENAGYAPYSGPWITEFSGNNQITIELWCKFSAVSTQSMLLCDTDPFHQIYINTNRTIEIQLGDGMNWQLDMVSNGTLSVNTWHYIAFTYDKASNNAILYLDGSQDKQATPASPCKVCNTGGSRGCYIGSGASGSGCFFSGSIDEVRLSDCVRSASDIQTYYNNAK